jgi:hypothetical protein
LNLDFALIAEAAAAANGKLYLHGAGVRKLDVPILPWNLSLAIVLRFTALPAEQGDSHDLSVFVQAPDGRRVIEGATLSMMVAEPMSPEADELGLIGVMEFAFGVAEEGWWQFDLRLDEEPLEVLRLKIVVAPPDPTQAPPAPM